MGNQAQILIGVGIVTAFLILLSDPEFNSSPQPQVTKPQYRNIQKKRLVTGIVVPEIQIDIKPHISGILEETMVSVGDSVKKGDPIARIRILPELVSLEQAEMRLRIAKINVIKEDRNFHRNQNLYQNGIISESEFDAFSNSYLLAQEELASAKNQREIVLEGGTNRSGDLSNIVQSTLTGVILELPIREGSSVIKRNNFQEGTTVATVADLNTLSFKGEIHENDIMYIKEGMQVPVSVAAWNNMRLPGIISQVALQGIVVNGINKFQFQVALERNPLSGRPCGVSGIAEIVLLQTSKVLVMEEKNLWFVNDSSFVDIFDPESGDFYAQFVKTGLSDGIFIQILEGLTPESQVKIRN